MWVRRRWLNQENSYGFRGLNFPLADVIHLLVGALCVCAVYLLDLEISDRRKTDMHLRLMEQERSSLRHLGNSPRTSIAFQ